jgi:hypothetical protein
MMEMTFADAVNKYHGVTIPDHLTMKLTQSHRVMRDLKQGEVSWLSKQEKDSPEYDLFYHLLELQYFLQDLEEHVPLAHEMIRKCYNVWAEEPMNSRMVEDMMADIWD